MPHKNSDLERENEKPAKQVKWSGEINIQSENQFRLFIHSSLERVNMKGKGPHYGDVDLMEINFSAWKVI